MKDRKDFLPNAISIVVRSLSQSIPGLATLASGWEQIEDESRFLSIECFCEYLESRIREHIKQGHRAQLSEDHLAPLLIRVIDKVRFEEQQARLATFAAILAHSMHQDMNADRFLQHHFVELVSVFQDEHIVLFKEITAVKSVRYEDLAVKCQSNRKLQLPRAALLAILNDLERAILIHRFYLTLDTRLFRNTDPDDFEAIHRGSFFRSTPMGEKFGDYILDQLGQMPNGSANT